MLQLRERRATFGSPRKGRVFTKKRCEWTGDVGEVLEKPTKVGAQSKEAPQVLKCSGFLNIMNRSNLLGVRPDSIVVNKEAKHKHLPVSEMALLRVQDQASLFDALKNIKPLGMLVERPAENYHVMYITHTGFPLKVLQ